MKLHDALLLSAILTVASSPATARQLAPEQLPVLHRTDPQTVVVDDDYDASTPGWQSTRFDKIQDGVNAVVPGGTVLVLAGRYAEDVLVEKPLTLSGAPGHVAEVEGVGGKSVFTVTADGAVIEGFLVRSLAPQWVVQLRSSSNTFRDNRNLGSHGLVRIEDGSDDNAILDNDLAGRVSIGSYYGDGGDRNLIEGNSMLEVGMARSHWNVIRNNAVASTSIGIELTLCDDNEISGNDVQFGYGGIDLDQSHRNRIFANMVSGDVYRAVRLAESHSCSVTANVLVGRVRITGVDLVYCDDAYVADNVFASPDGLGISVYQCTEARILDNSMSRGGIGFGAYTQERQYWDSHEIAGNTVHGAPIYYHVDTPDLVVPPDAAQVILVGCDHALVEGLVLHDVSTGIELAFCADVVVSKSAFLELPSGVSVVLSQAVAVQESTFIGGSTAVHVSGSNHVVNANRIEGAYIGIEVGGDGCAVTRNDVAFVELGIIFGAVTGGSAALNTLLGNAQGMLLVGSRGVLVSENRIESSAVAGVVLRGETVESAIQQNTIVGGGNGVWIEEGPTGNTIAENGIAGNEVGVLSPSTSSSGNRIFHNDFANLENASEAGTNVWDDGFPSGGNHWDDYWGVDLDHDGLGEAPYLIPGGTNEDAYPWMELQGDGAALWCDAPAVSAASGGQLAFHLYAGPSREGRIYVLLGSASGTEPGIPLPGGLVLPLVYDPFTRMVLASLGSPAFAGFAGVFDKEGASDAAWTSGPLGAGFVGLRLSFAYALVEAWELVSWPVTVAVVE